MCPVEGRHKLVDPLWCQTGCSPDQLDPVHYQLLCTLLGPSWRFVRRARVEGCFTIPFILFRVTCAPEIQITADDDSESVWQQGRNGRITTTYRAFVQNLRPTVLWPTLATHTNFLHIVVPFTSQQPASAPTSLYMHWPLAECAKSASLLLVRTCMASKDDPSICGSRHLDWRIPWYVYVNIVNADLSPSKVSSGIAISHALGES